jgi:hypothetical protein
MKVLSGEVLPGDHIRVDADKDALTFSTRKAPKA